jgi:hypothetical protein
MLHLNITSSGETTGARQQSRGGIRTKYETRRAVTDAAVESRVRLSVDRGNTSQEMFQNV